MALHGPCGDDDFDPTYQGPPLGSVHGPGIPASVCETTLRLIYEGIVPALYCFYRNPKLGGRAADVSDVRASRSLSGARAMSDESAAGWAGRPTLEMSQVSIEAREAVATALDGLVWSTNVEVDSAVAPNISDLVRDLTAVLGPSCQRTYEVVWLPTAKRCLDLVSDPSIHRLESKPGDGLLNDLVYAERPSSISSLISGMTVTALPPVVSGGPSQPRP